MGQFFKFIGFSCMIFSATLFLKGCGGALEQGLTMLATHSQTSMTVQTQIQGIMMQLQNLQSRLPFIPNASQGYTIYQTLTQVQMQLMGGATGSLPAQQVTVQVVTEQINILMSYLTGLVQQIPIMTHRQLATLAPKLQVANSAITSAGVGIGFGMSGSGFIPGSNMGMMGTGNMGFMGGSSMGMSSMMGGVGYGAGMGVGNTMGGMGNMMGGYGSGMGAGISNFF